MYFCLKAHEYELKIFVTAFIRPGKDQARENPSVEGGVAQEVPPIAKELLATSSYWAVVVVGDSERVGGRERGSGGKEDTETQKENQRESNFVKDVTHGRWTGGPHSRE